MKNEKQIQEAVWKHCVKYIETKYDCPEMGDTKEVVEQAVAKTIELMKPIGIIRHEPIDVDAYKCGYEAAAKEIVEKNIVPDITANIIQKNGFDEGYAACVREIEEKLSKDNTISFDSWKQGYTEGCTESLQAVKRFMMLKIKSLPIKKEYAELYEEIDTLLKELLPRKLDGRVKRMATLKEESTCKK